MKIKLVLDDWQRNGKSLANTTASVFLSTGDFPAGCTFNGTIKLTVDQRLELLASIAAGYRPVFWIDIDREGGG